MVWPTGSSASDDREGVIAIVRQRFLAVEVITRYQPRTNVERWQIQDRLGLRIRQLGCDVPPRFYVITDGRLAFRVRLGWRPPARVVSALGDIDDPPPTG